MFKPLVGLATEFFRSYLQLLKEGKIFEAISCWDTSVVSSKLPNFLLFIIATVFAFSFVFSWRGIFIIFLLKKILDDVKLWLIFLLSILVFTIILRFLFIYSVLGFLVSSDKAVFSRGVKIISEKERGNVIIVKYIVGKHGVYEALLKKDGDSFKILQSKHFIRRCKANDDSLMDKY
jgi:hypothetical protein